MIDVCTLIVGLVYANHKSISFTSIRLSKLDQVGVMNYVLSSRNMTQTV